MQPAKTVRGNSHQLSANIILRKDPVLSKNLRGSYQYSW
jgi:hypothetical protein